MDFNGAREANRFTRQTLDAGAKRQIVTLNALCENFTCQVLLLRHFSGITAPVVAGYHASVEGEQQRQ